MKVKVTKGRRGRYTLHISDNRGGRISLPENAVPELLRAIEQAQHQITMKKLCVGRLGRLRKVMTQEA